MVLTQLSAIIGYPKLWIDITRVRYGLIVIGILSIFFNYKVNISAYLGESRVNNFIDLVVSPTDFFIILVGVLVALKFRVSHIAVSISLIPLIISRLSHPSLAALWEWATTLSVMIVLGWIVYELWRSEKVNHASKVALFVSLITLSLFDYYILTETIVVVLVAVVYLLIATPQASSKLFYSVAEYALTLWFGVNAFLSVFQITTRSSLGLKYMGEPFLRFGELGLARQIIPFSDMIILRPYGLVAHPNVLGGIALLAIMFGLFAPFKKVFPVTGNALVGFASMALILSMSRSAIVALFVTCMALVLITFIQRKNVYLSFKLRVTMIGSIAISLALATWIGFLSLTRLSTSDVYRFEDLQRFGEVYADLDFWQYLLGIGVGQYPQFLFDTMDLSPWQYQPVHSIPLYVFISFGIIPSLGLILYVVTKIFDSPVSSPLPIILYVQWYDSKSKQRNMEHQEVLRANIEQNLFSRIVVFVEQDANTDWLQPYLTSDKVEILQLGHRMRFSDCSHYAVSQELHYMVVANSDIQFDTTIQKVAEVCSPNTFLAITRYEDDAQLMSEGREDTRGYLYSHSQDTWVVRSDENFVFETELELGTPGCDHRLALRAVQLGYSIINPCDIVHTTHYHGSDYRTYVRSELDYSGPRLFPSVLKDNYSIIVE